MRMLPALVAVAIAVSTGSAFAAEQYWIVKDAKTGKCEISERKPDGKATLVVQEQHFKSKAEAERQLKTDDKTMKVCKA